jgi:oxaloacetate decarboxylase beta subunit
MKKIITLCSLLFILCSFSYANNDSINTTETTELAATTTDDLTQTTETQSEKPFDLKDGFIKFCKDSGIYSILTSNWKALIMLCVSFLLLFLAIVKGFEPLLLLPIAFGMLLSNLPGAEMFHHTLFSSGAVDWSNFLSQAGMIDYLYLGVKFGIYPCLIFVGIGAMTDFGPLIANPKALLIGAGAQFGIFFTYFVATMLGFTGQEAGSIGIIGVADGPTAIYLTSKLAPHLLGAIAIAAYSYMALIPVIQPPLMRLLTNDKERRITMKQLSPVSKKMKILFPIIITVASALLVPSSTSLIGCLMLGNLLKECGAVERLSKTVQNELMNIVTVFLGISVGATAAAGQFLTWQTIKIIILGVVAFGFSTVGGILIVKVMNLFSKNKINPLIGSAGVSAVPMAARVSQVEGRKYDKSNHLLMHAMGPNVAGVIGSAIAAGLLLSFLG